MPAFERLTGVAAPLPEADIDTDIIFPARFLLLMDKAGLGRHLFHERRFKPATDRAPFVLNTPPFDHAAILVAGRNFGSGSSREHAVWALLDFGIRCVIAPSFGEIFHANCFKNGLLAIALEEARVDRVMAAAATGSPLTVDLAAGSIALPDSEKIPFGIDRHHRRLLLLGLDEIGGILAEDAEDIARFERSQRLAAPWLYLEPAQLAHFDDIDPEESGRRQP